MVARICVVGVVGVGEDEGSNLCVAAVSCIPVKAGARVIADQESGLNVRPDAGRVGFWRRAPTLDPPSSDGAEWHALAVGFLRRPTLEDESERG